MHLTAFELTVLERIVSGEDPWLGGGIANGSRKVSQAIQRLKRKGAIMRGPGHWVATAEGHAYLAGKISAPAP